MTTASVRLWGTTIGAISMRDTGVAEFAYEPGFLRSGIEVSPVVMPLSSRRYSFPELARGSFHGLPGLVADALPDAFGKALIDAWLAGRGRTSASFNAVERLCYTGVRGMGALEFSPSAGPSARGDAQVDIAWLVELAGDVLSQRNRVGATLDGAKDAEALAQILKVGTSAGGARAKAVIGWNPETNELRSGQTTLSDGFEHWLLKFDGVAANGDKELADPRGYGAVEFAYSKMATAAGIQMSECRLLDEGGRRHFMTRRFDRRADGDKVHMQSLGAIAHYDFNQAGAHSYEQALRVARTLGLPIEQLEELFRRMVFNLVARNQDDHVKNIAFLMDRAGRWELSPAYDVTYAFNPVGTWTQSHQMSVNGRRDGFGIADLKACAANVFLRRGLARDVLAEVIDSVSRWLEFAEEAGVPEGWAARIGATHRLSWRAE